MRHELSTFVIVACTVLLFICYYLMFFVGMKPNRIQLKEYPLKLKNPHIIIFVPSDVFDKDGSTPFHANVGELVATEVLKTTRTLILNNCVVWANPDAGDDLKLWLEQHTTKTTTKIEVQ